MSRNYKFSNPEGLYFVSFAVVGWLDVFRAEDYKYSSPLYYTGEKGLLNEVCVFQNFKI